MNRATGSIITASNLVQHFQLQPHPEGGYYKEVYRSGFIIKNDALPGTFSGNRNIATSIYFLLQQNNFSSFHRIKSDETWHFYAGGALDIYVINQTGELQIIKLGNNLLNEEVFQFTVPANCWFASKPAVESVFSFVGCTVYPGFDFNDFELAERNKLIKLYPLLHNIIALLTR